MRLPNSYGSIVKLSGKRRRPYAVRITTGWTDEGRQIQKYLSYHATRREAMAALAEYNKSPFDLDNQKITFAEMYERWATARYDGEVIPEYRAAYKHLKGLYDMPFVEIRKRHIQAVIDSATTGFSSKSQIKSLCSLIFRYAMDMEIVPSNQAAEIELPENIKSDIHTPFTDEELATLWQYTDDTAARFALVLSYTGLRPSELLKIRTKDVHISDRYMHGGLKTQAGKDRDIPIAEKIMPFIQSWFNPANEYLVTNKKGKAMSYYTLRSIWENSPIMQSLPTPHLMGDGRHTCASLLAKAKVDLLLRQRILGHRPKNITEDVYTHNTITELIEAINLI